LPTEGLLGLLREEKYLREPQNQDKYFVGRWMSMNAANGVKTLHIEQARMWLPE
jgi:hypothetical protein